jgi:ATP-dependent Zn protease
MGGRAAEEISLWRRKMSPRGTVLVIFDKATRLTRVMVTRYGFFGKRWVWSFMIWMKTKRRQKPKLVLLNAEVAKRIADSSYQRAKKLLTKQKKEHKLVAERLLEFETLTGEEVRNIVLHKRKPVRASKPQAAAAAAAAADKKNNSSNTTTTTLK